MEIRFKKRAIVGALVAAAVAISTAGCTASSGSALKFGALIPETGALAFLGAPIQAGYQLAIDDINAAGGVNGQQVSIKYADEADASTPTVVQNSANTLLTWGANVILGASSSSNTKNAIDNIVAHKVVEISPSNTSPDLTAWKDNGFYYRTAPSDLVQGQVLGNQIIADGNSKVAIIYQDSSYGNGLEGTIASTVKAKGGTVTAAVKFTTGQSDFSSIVTQALAGGPQAIALVSYDESNQALPALKAAGFAGGSKIYLVDGNHVDYSKSSFAAYLNGATATEPTAGDNAAFDARLKTDYKKVFGKDLTEFTYATQAYDAVMVAALAATKAGKNDGTSIRDNLTAMTSGTTKVTTFKDGVDAIKAGKAIHYYGFSGPIDFDANGDPAAGTIGVFKYVAAGTSTLQTVVAANAVK